MTVSALGALQVATQQTPGALFSGMCRKADGTYLHVYRRGNNHLSFDGEIVCRHQIAGTTNSPIWGSEITVFSHLPGTWDARGGIPRLLPDGRIIVAMWETQISGGVRVFHRSMTIESTDASATSWQPAASALYVPNHQADMGNANEGPVLMMPNGDQYLAVYEAGGSGSHWSSILYKRAGGTGAWTYDRYIAQTTNPAILYEEPFLLRLVNGHVLCAIRQVDGSGQYTHIWRSTDNLATWTDEGIPVTAWPSASRPAIAQNPSTGTVMLHHRSVTSGSSAAGGYTYAPSPSYTKQTRAVNSGPTTIFASNGVTGTYGAHYAFPDATLLADGTTEFVVCRKATSHNKYDGDIVAKKRPSGGAWSAESRIFAGGWTSADDTGSGYDIRMADVCQLRDGRLGIVMYKRTGTTAGYNNGDDRCFPVFTYCPAGADPMVAANWSAHVPIATSGTVPNWTATSDLIELADGTLYCATYGTPAPIWTKDRCDLSKSVDGGATWTYVGLIDDGTGLSGSLNSCGEAQLAVLPDGKLLTIFRTIAAPWEVWGRISTNVVSASTNPTWGSRFLLASNSINRAGLCSTSDGDYILTYNSNGTSIQVTQSWDGSTWGTPFALGYSGNVFESPYQCGATGTTPNVAIVSADEIGGQTQSSVKRSDLTRGRSNVIPAPGPWAAPRSLDNEVAMPTAFTPPMYSYGDIAPITGGFAAIWTNETPRSGFGQPEIMFRTFQDDAPLLLTPGLTLGTSAYWAQAGTALTVTGSTGVRTAVQATVVSTGGGLVRFTGTHANRFTASLDNSTWTPTITVPAGSTTIYISVLPQSGDTTLTASVGVPV